MRRYLAIALVLCGISIGMPQEGYADGVCTPNKEYKDAFNDATGAEKSGNLPLAFAAYKDARGEHGCEGPNLFSKEAQAGWKRVGLRLAKEMEAKGNYYSNGSYSEGFGSSRRRWTLWKDVGAFHWYKEIDDSAAMDRVMLKHIQSMPRDMGAFRTALEHFFQGFNGGMNNAETLRDLVQQAKSSPGDKALQTRVGYLKELEKIALKNIDEELIQEEKAYNMKQTSFEAAFSQKNKPVIESQQHLRTARDWYDLFSDLKGNKAVERAEKRGDASAKVETPQSLANAKAYYGLAEDSGKARKVTDHANRLGDAHAKKKEYATAVHYYEIGHSDTGENEDKIKELQSYLEKENEKKEQAKEKVLKDMTKDEKQQKEFKKGQEDLEKELGF